MVCPEDGGNLIEDGKGLFTCRRCRGRAVSGAVFSQIHQEVRELLRPEGDRGSGAYARVRLCPRCRQAMSPLRMADQLAWLEWCGVCEVLWIEKLDEAVIKRLEYRRALARGAEGLDPKERQELAGDIAREVAGDHREVRLLGTIGELLCQLFVWP